MMTGFGNFFRALTDLALAPRFRAALGQNSLDTVPGGPNYFFGQPGERDFCDGFWCGANFAGCSADRTSPAYENGARLGFRLRTLRKEHGLVTDYGTDREKLECLLAAGPQVPAVRRG